MYRNSKFLSFTYWFNNITMSDSESEGDVEVIEVKAANSLVPNLTISVEKDDEEATVEFQEDEMQENVEEKTSTGVEVKVCCNYAMQDLCVCLTHALHVTMSATVQHTLRKI